MVRASAAKPVLSYEKVAKIVEDLVGIPQRDLVEDDSLYRKVVVIGCLEGSITAIDHVLAHPVPQRCCDSVLIPMGIHSRSSECEAHGIAVIEHYSGTFSVQDLERLQAIYEQHRRNALDAPRSHPPERVGGQMWAWCRISPRIDRAKDTECCLSTGTEEFNVPLLLGKGNYDSMDHRAHKSEYREQPILEDGTEPESLDLYEDFNELLDDFLWRYVIMPFDEKGRTR